MFLVTRRLLCFGLRHVLKEKRSSWADQLSTLTFTDRLTSSIHCLPQSKGFFKSHYNMLKSDSVQTCNFNNVVQYDFNSSLYNAPDPFSPNK